MICKMVKIGAGVTAVGLLAGGVVFGDELFSYARSSVGMAQSAVKESVPVEFELRRARDLLDQIIPEMHANVRLIATEEVEIGELERQITAAQDRLGEETRRVATLRDMLDTDREVFTVSHQQFSRTRVRDDLARRLDRVREAQAMVTSKKKLLDSRQSSLAAAQDMLDRTRSEKVRLEDKIETLEAQHRMVQAAAVGSQLDIDHSKIAQTEKLLEQIRKRLDVAERVLTHESRFTQPIPVDVVDEAELLSEVDAFLLEQHDEPAESVTLR